MKVFSLICALFMASNVLAIGQYDGVVIPHRCGSNADQKTARVIPTVCEVSVMKHSKGYKSGLVVYYYSAGKVRGYFYQESSLSMCLPTTGSNHCAQQYTAVATVEGDQVLWGTTPNDKPTVTTNTVGTIKSLSAAFLGSRFHTLNMEYIAPSL